MPEKIAIKAGSTVTAATAPYSGMVSEPILFGADEYDGAGEAAEHPKAGDCKTEQTDHRAGIAVAFGFRRGGGHRRCTNPFARGEARVMVNENERSAAIQGRTRADTQANDQKDRAVEEGLSGRSFGRLRPTQFAARPCAVQA
jgi:hypothetical protein